MIEREIRRRRFDVQTAFRYGNGLIETAEVRERAGLEREDVQHVRVLTKQLIADADSIIVTLLLKRAERFSDRVGQADVVFRIGQYRVARCGDRRSDVA